MFVIFLLVLLLLNYIMLCWCFDFVFLPVEVPRFVNIQRSNFGIGAEPSRHLCLSLCLEHLCYIVSIKKCQILQWEIFVPFGKRGVRLFNGSFWALKSSLYSHSFSIKKNVDSVSLHCCSFLTFIDFSSGQN